jgi:hypothetical protein
MKISLSGMTGRICAVLDSSGSDYAKGYSFQLQEMVRHLAELKARREEGTAVIDEFFAIYVDVP